MSQPSASRRVVKFGIFEADLCAQELRKNGVKLRLAGQPFQVLALLLENPGGVVTREELRLKLWPVDTFVDFDNALNRCINKIREALNDSAESPRYIETLSRRGYRFLQSFEHKRGGEISSIAVLPLENLSRDPEQEYFADGLTEALITHLAKISSLRVVSRTTAMQYKGVRKPMPEIARELQVDVVVEGTVRRSGDRVRISAQLIDAANEAHLWAESYERDMRDALRLETELAGAIAREIQVKLTPQEKLQLARSRPVDPEAYDAYLKGRYHWNRRGLEALTRSAAFFQQAIDKDPSYAAAYAGLADSASRLGYWGHVRPAEGCARARIAALKAIEIDDSLSEAHAALAFAVQHDDFAFPIIEQACLRAIELNSQNANARGCYSLYFLAQARFDEALEQIFRGVQLDPFSMPLLWGLSAQLWVARQYDRAIAQARKLLEFDPSYVAARWTIALCQVQKGSYEQAIFEMEEAVRNGARTDFFLGALGHCYGMSGRKLDARRILNQMEDTSKDQYMAPFWKAVVCASLNDKDEAFRWLDLALLGRSASMVYTKVFPPFDPLRSDPRFDDLLRRMNYPT
jgi:TolB-like protein